LDGLVFYDKEDISKAVNKIIYFKENFNGQTAGSMAQSFFTQIINKKSNYHALDISKKVERYGIKTDIILSKEKIKSFDIKALSNYIQISLKTTWSNSNIIQLTTNYKLRTILNDKKSNLITGDSLDNYLLNDEFKEFKEIKNIFFSFGKNTFSLYLFNSKKFFNDISYIKLKQNRIHSQYNFYNKEDNKIAKLLYGEDRANAFQRGLWFNINYETKKYLIPLIDLPYVKEHYELNFF